MGETTLGGPARGEAGAATEDAKKARIEIGEIDRGLHPALTAALFDRESLQHKAAVAYQTALHRRAEATNPSTDIEERRAEALKAKVELDALDEGRDPEFLKMLFDKEHPGNAAAAKKWKELHARSVAAEPDQVDPAEEVARYGFELTPEERRGHAPLPQPLRPMTWQEGAAAVKEVEGAYWDRDHGQHNYAVERVSEIFERVEMGDRIAEGEES